MKFRICVLTLAFSAALMSGLNAKEYAVNSPDGQVSASFELKKGALFYSVSRDGIPVLSSSKVEIFTGAKMKVIDHSMRENDSSWEPVWGEKKDLSIERPELAAQLLLELKAWTASVNAPVRDRINPLFNPNN